MSVDAGDTASNICFSLPESRGVNGILWLGGKDSNLQPYDPKSSALPLRHRPMISRKYTIARLRGFSFVCAVFVPEVLQPSRAAYDTPSSLPGRG